ncbi:hypothetical protein WH52_10890 [Tenacibaculum holothuriorum]|uniref:HTH araC/xylS-type domain-containing protein n=1 Tax=Tenacibaculum holothuriorum TaxID=1635173 RepID=A0A1Y2PC50_9FLAO|nr:helix-turn-helix transcriptional regulator [Tenacibaculum holothuriorum]OSY87591.1 hypothetical protein WH52_10890 [Tenacibaculum holothuriorum]
MKKYLLLFCFIFLSINYVVSFQKPNNNCKYLTDLRKKAKELYFKGEQSASRKVCIISLSFIESIEDNSECIVKLHSKILGRLFYIEKNALNYSKALFFLDLNKKLQKKFPFYFPSYNYSIKLQEASILSRLDEKEKSNTILFKMLENKEKFKHIALGEIFIYNHTIDNYFNLFSEENKTWILDSIINHSKKAYDIFYEKRNELKQDKYKDAISTFYTRLGRVEKHKENYEKATVFLKLAKENNTDKESIFIDLHLSSCYFYLNKPDSTIHYAKSFLQKNKDLKASGRLLYAYNILSKQYYKLQEKDSAYKYAKLTLSEVNKNHFYKNKGIKKMFNNNIDKIKLNNQNILKSQKKSFISILLLLIIIIIFSTFLFSYKYYKSVQKEKKYLKLVKELRDKSNKKKQKAIKIKDESIERIIESLNYFEKSEEYLNSNFTLYNVAKRINTNTTYLSKIINQKKNTNFKEYVNKLRMEYVITEIAEGEKFQKYSIEAIAKEVGFSNASTFSKAFKKYTGISPSYYIKKVVSDKESK